MAQSKSYIDLVNECDKFPYPDTEFAQGLPTGSYFKFHIEGCTAVLGYVLPEVAQKIATTEEWDRNNAAMTLTFRPASTPPNPEEAAKHRTEALARHLQLLRQAKVFRLLDGWRNELYSVYGLHGELLFNMERAASPLFGIVTYGVHMTAYVETEAGMKLWVPRRSSTKQTYPGMLDNTVAGGLSTGERPFECLIRESMEEASLPESVVKKAHACGTMTYFYICDERAGGEVGLCQPECQYVYDLVLPAGVVPQPGDDEAVDFQLLSIPEVQAAMAAGKFKPNCALLLVEFFVRHGIITAENEPNYLEIVSRLHRRLEFPMGRVSVA